MKCSHARPNWWAEQIALPAERQAWNWVRLGALRVLGRFSLRLLPLTLTGREISVYTSAPRQLCWFASSKNEKMGHPDSTYHCWPGRVRLLEPLAEGQGHLQFPCPPN